MEVFIGFSVCLYVRAHLVAGHTFSSIWLQFCYWSGLLCFHKISVGIFTRARQWLFHPYELFSESNLEFKKNCSGKVLIIFICKTTIRRIKCSKLPRNYDVTNSSLNIKWGELRLRPCEEKWWVLSQNSFLSRIWFLIAVEKSILKKNLPFFMGKRIMLLSALY